MNFTEFDSIPVSTQSDAIAQGSNPLEIAFPNGGEMMMSSDLEASIESNITLDNFNGEVFSNHDNTRLSDENFSLNDEDTILVGRDGIDTDSPTPISIASPTPQSSDSGAKYYVDKNGSDDNPGTKEKPWKTIDYAVSEDSAIKPGDTILVQPGTYTELITLGKSGNSGGNITLKADGKVTLRDPDATKGGFYEGVIQSKGKSNWTIEGFRIENTSWAGIALADAKNMVIKDNHTYKTGASGIIVFPGSYYDGGEKEVTSSNIKVLNNTIEKANSRWKGNGDTNGTQEALSIWGVDGFEVAKNTLKEGNREGIDIKTGSRNGSVHSNSVTGQALVAGTPGGYRGGPSIYVDGGRSDIFNIDIYNNKVFNNTADGILIGDESPKQGDVSDIRIYNNVVYGNGKQGINGGTGIAVTSNVEKVKIVNNTLADNVQGVFIDDTFNNGGYNPRDVLIRNNIFANNSYRNGWFGKGQNITVDNNLFAGNSEKTYESGSKVSNLKADDNKAVKSAGFVNRDNKDFHLTSTSPAVDIGSNNIGGYAKKDKDGVSRDGKPDLGAYEYVG